MDYVQLVNNKIDVDQIYNLILDDGCGACSVFVGTTRDSFDGKKVISLEYEAYESMALKEMQKICTELRVRWPNLKHIALHHRLGVVPVREASVVIAVSSPHRAAALESVSFAIDQLKSQVPIWKKEIYEDDPVGEWKENKECQWPPKYSESSARSFDLSNCKIDQNLSCAVDDSERLVQIRVNDSELNRRVECFLKRKRDEINLFNINDYMKHSYETESVEVQKDSCARTQSILIKQQQSSGHLKVRRVNNNCGPQVRPDYSHQLGKLMPTHSSNDLSEDSLSRYSRLKSIESYMCIHSDDNDSIMTRIKNIENRILLLESSSPEYKNIVQFKTDENDLTLRKSKKKVYLSENLDNVILKLKKDLEK